ncbi:MAG: hypothetical protein RM338_32745 [Nostoc sp. DedQUE12a]|nr:hypothetical protein [Nostoc sp. DedQUE12a]
MMRYGTFVTLTNSSDILLFESSMDIASISKLSVICNPIENLLFRPGQRYKDTERFQSQLKLEMVYQMISLSIEAIYNPKFYKSDRSRNSNLRKAFPETTQPT